MLLLTIITNTNPLAKVELFIENAARPHVSPDGRFLAFHRKNDKGIYNIYVLDFQTGDTICLTCVKTLPSGHKGQPWWHPTGKWIIYQAEKEKHIFPYPHPLSVPGIGYHNDIWIVNVEDIHKPKHYKLVDIPTKKHVFDRRPSSAVLQPNFSRDGKKVAWSQRIDDGEGWGRWAIKVGDFVVENGIPKIVNIKTFTPGENKNYYEANEFGLNNNMMLITGNLETGQSVEGSDIYWFNLETGEVKNLTNNPKYFDECPHLSPDGSLIGFLSTREFRHGKSPAWWMWAKGEFWIMDTSGKNPRRLTYFNEPGYPEYIGKRVIPEYITFAPDGKTIYVSVAIEVKKGKFTENIYRVLLKE